MLKNSNLVALIATSKPAEAKRFYGEVLGLDLVADDPFAIVYDANGVMLRIQKMQSHTPQPQSVLGWGVADIDDSIAKLANNGVKFERYAGLEQDDFGVWASPNGAKIAWFKDPDGNTISLTQFP